MERKEMLMRDYTINKIRPGLYELDLYINGSWVHSHRGSKCDVQDYATKYINRPAPRMRPIMS
jgi:outer membrane usher protein FimD/PapC